MKTPKVDTSGTERAQKAVADAQLAANNLRQNFGADLQTENLTKVTPGGGADLEAGDDIVPGRKKRTAGGGLSSALGITG